MSIIVFPSPVSTSSELWSQNVNLVTPTHQPTHPSGPRHLHVLPEGADLQPSMISKGSPTLSYTLLHNCTFVFLVPCVLFAVPSARGISLLLVPPIPLKQINLCWKRKRYCQVSKKICCKACWLSPSIHSPLIP